MTTAKWRTAFLVFVIVLMLVDAQLGPVMNNLIHTKSVKPVDWMSIGGRPSAFGFLPGNRSGLTMYDDHVAVRWEIIHATPIVTGITAAWSLEDQQDFLSSGESLLLLADRFVRRWAPADSVYIAQTRLGVGGTALFAYRSDELRKALGNSNNRRVEAGDFYVVIVLDSSFEDSEVPIVATEFEKQDNLEEAIFTIGLIVGSPWRAPDD